MYREAVLHTNMQQKHHKVMSSCVCLHVGRSVWSPGKIQKQPLLQLCRYPEHICHFCVVLYRTIISQWFKIFISCFTVYKKTDFLLALFQYFLLLLWNKEQSVYWKCSGAAMFVPMPEHEHHVFIYLSLPYACSCLWHRNWCAYVVTRTISCVMEDGVETYIKPDYQRCTWGQCPRVAWVYITH